MCRKIKFTLSVLVTIIFFVSCASTGENTKSDYLRKSYGIPTEYSEKTDEMTGTYKLTSPGIILKFASIGWDNTGMWWIVRSRNGEKNTVLIIKARMSSWSFFNQVYIKIREEIIEFSEDKKNLSNDRDVISNGVSEFVACYMDIELMKRIINEEEFYISIRGSEGQQDYTVQKEQTWERLLNQ